MRILIAEDDLVSRRLLETTLARAGHEVVSAEDGRQALDAFEAAGGSAPRLLILDWMMPVLDGIEVCRRVRLAADPAYVYIILLTAKGRKEDVVRGLDAGADDYITKPFDPHELRSRVRAGSRILELHAMLASKVVELQDALAQVKRLQGLLPICMHCKRIRDDRNSWRQLEAYISERSEAEFSHSICKECLVREYPDLAEEIGKRDGR